MIFALASCTHDQQCSRRSVRRNIQVIYIIRVSCSRTGNMAVAYLGSRDKLPQHGSGRLLETVKCQRQRARAIPQVEKFLKQQQAVRPTVVLCRGRHVELAVRWTSTPEVTVGSERFVLRARLNGEDPDGSFGQSLTTTYPLGSREKYEYATAVWGAIRVEINISRSSFVPTKLGFLLGDVGHCPRRCGHSTSAHRGHTELLSRQPISVASTWRILF